MNEKYNKFTTLFETAFTHYSNGGFREGTSVILKSSFLSHPYCKSHYSGHGQFMDFLKELIKDGVRFFIKRVVADGATQNKSANDNEGAGEVYLVLRTDPRKVQWPTEFNEFTIPGSFDILEIKDDGINLPPLDGVPNKYERPFGQDIKIYKMEVKIGNQPIDSQLPTKNTSLKFTSKPQAAKVNAPKKL